MMMQNILSFIKNIYQNFNDRKIDLVINEMTNNVQWANGMDGGYVYGHAGVREYWTRQFGLVSSNVIPLQIDEENDVVKIKVHQIVHDINGNLLSDDIVYHYFTLKNGKIARFDIGDSN
jgi:hypothetical protein